MHKFIRIALVLASVASAIMAYDFVVTLEPASPIIPFVLMFLSGLAFRQACD